MPRRSKKAMASSGFPVRLSVGMAVALAASLLLRGPATHGTLAGEEECLGCHSDTGLARESAGGELRSLHVEPEEWRLSPHSTIGCGGCHSEIDVDDHPEGEGAGTAPEDATEWAKRCRGCHGKEADSTPVHVAMLTQPSPPACSLCHSPHRMRAVREWKPKVSASIYCLTCHQQKMRVSLESGETLSLTIRDAARGASVHLDHQCTDCHEAFSKLEHPLRAEEDLPGQDAARYELCRGCHEEQYSLFEGSLHFKMAKYGHSSAPLCTDCHGYHAVAPVKSFEVLSGLPCRRCHAEVFKSFMAGPHRSGPRAEAHTEVPVCINCHRAHESGFTPVKELVNDTCLVCHSEAAGSHGSWLPETSTHFEAVSCTACHTPAARRRFVVRVFDREKRSYVSLSPATPAVDPDLAARLRQKDGAERNLAFWGDIVSSLNEAEGKGRERYAIVFEGEEEGTPHEIGQLEDAQRKCETCHEEDLRYLERVFGPSGR